MFGMFLVVGAGILAALYISSVVFGVYVVSRIPMVQEDLVDDED